MSVPWQGQSVRIDRGPIRRPAMIRIDRGVTSGSPRRAIGDSLVRYVRKVTSPVGSTNSSVAQSLGNWVFEMELRAGDYLPTKKTLSLFR